MTRTCIIGGGPAKSREHIFPAALGGRRTNKGIYCGKHNNEYSPLAALLKEQLDFFNAALGVVGDHADVPTSTIMKDGDTGAEIEMSAGQMRMPKPEASNIVAPDGRAITQMKFPTRAAAGAWLNEQRRNGVNVEVVGDMKAGRRFGNIAQKSIKLGGDAEGLRAIGYIGQTFFAHAFPEDARREELKTFKDYTLNDLGADFVLWDFEFEDATPNAFAFGHRIIVGLDANTHTAYCRVSLFSTLNFAMVLAHLPVSESRAMVTDVDPLAVAPPQDIVEHREAHARGAVLKPADTHIGLAHAIKSSAAQARLNALMQRIVTFQTDKFAAEIWRQLKFVGALNDAARKGLFRKTSHAEAQRVLNLMRYLANDLKSRAGNPIEQMFGAWVARASEADANADSGLTALAMSVLPKACDAIADQMDKDYAAGALDEQRVRALFGEGAGAAVIGRALTDIMLSGVN